MTDSIKVDEGVIEVRYSIYSHKMEDGVVYDWFTATGASSDQWFETIEDAIRDVEICVGG